MDKKRKFNVVDVLVILVIVAVVAFVGYKFVGGNMGSGGSNTYELKFLCEEVPEFAANVIEIGDKVLDEQKETDLGVVTDVKITESRTYGVASDGTITVNGKPHHNCVEVTTVVEGEDYDFGMISGSSKYGIGHSITIRVGKAKIFGRVSAIEKLETVEDVTVAE